MLGDLAAMVSANTANDQASVVRNDLQIRQCRCVVEPQRWFEGAEVKRKNLTMSA